jgi:hypothetical protein
MPLDDFYGHLAFERIKKEAEDKEHKKVDRKFKNRNRRVM